MKHLKEIRLQNNLTQKELSEQTKIIRQNISRYENGEVEPNISTLIKLADYFNVSVDYLIGHRQNNKIDISGLSDIQQNIIKMTTELDETNAIRVESYISAKIEAQNESQNQKKFN
ncbi:MAG: helix-turn-helix domain-containing protein [Firmicutes bacterium]|nr:helix-turn-helix domain-containing protein [Bacillota bacterium]MDY5586103.1 helix-turn-helix transcriptional regulator [Eubacteriales bacterium]